jgi:hypothetical protein
MLENSKQRPAPLDCLARTETFELLNPETRGNRWGDWRLIFIAESSGPLRRFERHCRRAEIRAGWPIRDPAPLAMVPLRGLGGDGGEGDANFRREISVMMTVRRGLKLRRVFTSRPMRLAAGPLHAISGDGTTQFGSLVSEVADVSEEIFDCAMTFRRVSRAP